MSKSATGSAGEGSFESAGRLDLTERTGTPSWTSKVVLTAGIGAPLGVVLIVDPAAAETQSADFFPSSDSFENVSFGTGFTSGSSETEQTELANTEPVGRGESSDLSADADTGWSVLDLIPSSEAAQGAPDSQARLGLHDGRHVTETIDVRPDGYTITSSYVDQPDDLVSQLLGKTTTHTRTIEFAADHKPAAVSTRAHTEGWFPGTTTVVDLLSVDEDGGRLVVVEEVDGVFGSSTNVEYGRVGIDGAAVAGGITIDRPLLSFRSWNPLTLGQHKFIEQYHYEARPTADDDTFGVNESVAIVTDGVVPVVEPTANLRRYFRDGYIRTNPVTGNHIRTEITNTEAGQDRFLWARQTSQSTRVGDGELVTVDVEDDVDHEIVVSWMGHDLGDTDSRFGKRMDFSQKLTTEGNQQQVAIWSPDTRVDVLAQPDRAQVSLKKEIFGDGSETHVRSIELMGDEAEIRHTSALRPGNETDMSQDYQMYLHSDGQEATLGNSIAWYTPDGKFIDEIADFRAFDLVTPATPVEIGPVKTSDLPAVPPLYTEQVPRQTGSRAYTLHGRDSND